MATKMTISDQSRGGAADSILMELRKFETTLHRQIEKAMPRTEKGKLFHVQALVLQFLKEREGEAVFQKDVESHLKIQSPSATKLLQRMEKRGLIVRIQDPSDQRKKRIATTEKASAIIDCGFAEIKRISEALETGIVPDEKAVFLRVLKKLNENAHAILEHYEFPLKEDLC